MPQRLRAEDLWSGAGEAGSGGSPIAALWGPWAHSPGLSVAAGSEERASLQMGSWARPNHQPGIELSGMLLAAPGNGRPQLPRSPSSVRQCLSSGWCSRRRLGRPVAHSLAKWPLPRPRPQGRSPSTCLLWSLLFDMLQLAAPLQSDCSPLKVLVVRFACCIDASLVQVVCVDEAKETDGRVEHERSVEISVPLLMAGGVCLGPSTFFLNHPMFGDLESLGCQAAQVPVLEDLPSYTRTVSFPQSQPSQTRERGPIPVADRRGGAPVSCRQQCK